MAGTGNGIDFAYFRYTGDGGVHWSVKVDTDWGGNAASGLSAFNATDLRFPVGKIWRPRKVVLQDLVSGRRTTRILGTSAATAGVAGATVTTVARGVTGTYTLTSLGVVGERTPKTGVITHKPEPIAT